MKHIPDTARYAFGVCAIVAVLGGCGDSRQIFSPASGTMSDLKTSPGSALAAVDGKHGKSWMVPGAAKMPTLLYVSNSPTRQGADVTVYTYLNGGGLQLVGTLTGFSMPTGMCTDKAGDVWIPDYGARVIYEYAHGGTTPIFKIKQNAGSPYDCSVDLNTDNLAVVNQTGRSNGIVKVYPKGSRTGKEYITPFFDTAVYFLAYDNQSNLYVDGINAYYGPELLELPSGGRGGRELTLLTLSGGIIVAPGAIQWAKPFLLLGDDDYQGHGTSVAYKLSVSGSVATIVGVVPFQGTQEAFGFWRRDKKLIVPDHLGNVVRIYTLPGGTLFSTLSKGIVQPFGAVVSQSP